MAVNRSSGGGSRPTSRERNSSSSSSRGTERRGGGLNLGGPVGNSGGYEDRPTGGGRSRGGGGFVWILLLVVILFYIGLTNGGGVSGIFENIFHSVREATEDVDTDEIAERFSGVIQNAGESLGLLDGGSGGRTVAAGAAAAVASRSIVGQFSGLLSGDADYSVSAISRGFDATEQYGGGIDASKFVWSKNSSGQRVLKLTDDEWDMIDTVKLNVFIDDGKGYIDLGLDPLFDFDSNGDLIGEFDGTWLCIDRYPAAFYHLTTIEDGEQYRIIGYVPAFLNGQHVNLILAFDNANPKGYIAGAKVIESGPGTDLTVEQMVSDLIEVKAGDKVDFVCDYYDYDGVFINNYFFGEQMTVSSSPEIKNYKIPGELSVCYRLEGYSGNHYWTPLID